MVTLMKSIGKKLVGGAGSVSDVRRRTLVPAFFPLLDNNLLEPIGGFTRSW